MPDRATSGRVMVDSNVLIDLVESDSRWYEWSARSVAECGRRSILAIDPIIYSEISAGFERVEEVEAAFPEEFFERRPLPWEAAFLAGKVHQRYRRSGGSRQATLPDFFIGAHALIEGMTLLTRDGTLYRTYFPNLRLIAPEPGES
jgi:predicted nucleic acid-binding protein